MVCLCPRHHEIEHEGVSGAESSTDLMWLGDMAIWAVYILVRCLHPYDAGFSVVSKVRNHGPSQGIVDKSGI